MIRTGVVGFTRVVGSEGPPPDGAEVDVTEFEHVGAPVVGRREIVAREGMVIHAAEVRGKMGNCDPRFARCEVKLCPATGSRREKVVIAFATRSNVVAYDTKLFWRATVTFVPDSPSSLSQRVQSIVTHGGGDGGGGVQEPTNSNSDFYTKLRLSMRLSMLCNAEDKVLTAWGKKSRTMSEVPLTVCTSFKPDEVEPVHLALEGEGAESGKLGLARWLMARADDVLYVAFKGTSTLKDTLGKTQLDSIQVASGVRMHSGFNTGVNDELEEIVTKCIKKFHNTRRVVFTGHSLGGAYAIAALLKLFGGRKLSCEAITFGAPLVAVSSTLEGRAELPPDVPPILNVVANYDIVPRLLAMTDVQVGSFMKHRLTSDNLLTGAAAIQFVLPRAASFTQELNELRRRYRPVGTFVFAQSHVEGKMRRTSATVVPSDDAAGILKQFPEVRWSVDTKSAEDDELAFAKQCVADHFPTGYWRIVKALCEGKDQVFASCVEKPSKGLSGGDECRCNKDLPERAIVNRLDKLITVAVQQHSFDVASGGVVSLKPLPRETKITISSTLLGDTKWDIAVPASGGLLVQKSNVLGYVARTYSVTDDGWEVGPVVSPHDAHGGHVDQLAALLNRRYPEGATARCFSQEPSYEV